MSDSLASFKKWAFLQDMLVITIGPILLYYLARKTLMRAEGPKDNPEAARRLEHILATRDEEYAAFSDSDSSSSSNSSQPRHRSRRKSRAPPREPRKISLTSYEQSIANEVVQPSTIPVSFADIGGLDRIISDLQESVIYPLTLPSLYRRSALLSAPTGVLLYGPPGCGKTMLAKALAHESGAVFINLHISTLTEKWYGDSNKLVAAVFSLARKLAPSIVFVDEIDAVLGTRRGSDHEASGMVKAEMMTHWDGLASADQAGRPQQVLILGATNRPQDIDEAILRRMPKRFAVGLPDGEQRRRIYELVLREAGVDVFSGRTHDGEQVNGKVKDEDLDGDVSGVDLEREQTLDLDWLVKMSAGLSGSDIKESCREAAMIPMRELIAKSRARGQPIRGAKPKDLRPLRTEDFMPYFASKLSLNRDILEKNQLPGDMRKVLEQAKRELENFQRRFDDREKARRQKKSSRKRIDDKGDSEDGYESVEEVSDSEDEAAKRALSRNSSKSQKREEKT